MSQTAAKQAHTVPADILFGKTAAMQQVRKQFAAVAKTRVPILVQGESGTGKELCVHWMHRFSGAPAKKLVKVSCPALPQALLETELFGYEKGAFTGAQTTKKGRVEQADGGTLFLDEVGSLDLLTQSKLLQIVQDGTFTSVGGHETQKIDTRLVSVANRDLREQVAEGSFRLDFLHRINGITIELVPLRDRMEDLPDLMKYFQETNMDAFGVRRAPLSYGTVRQMQRQEWPGNIRQLENMMRRYALIGDENELLAEMIDIPEHQNVIGQIDVSVPISLKLITKRVTHSLEREIILKVLKANSWNRQKTAKWLKISYRSLLYKLNEGTPFDPRKPIKTSLPKKEDGQPSLQTAPRIT